MAANVLRHIEAERNAGAGSKPTPVIAMIERTDSIGGQTAADYFIAAFSGFRYGALVKKVRLAASIIRAAETM